MKPVIFDPPVVPEWTLGWRLQRSLAHAGIGVEQMAKELGVSRSTVSRWMSDRGASPRSIYLSRWAERCRVSVGWLCEGKVGWDEELFGNYDHGATDRFITRREWSLHRLELAA